MPRAHVCVYGVGSREKCSSALALPWEVCSWHERSWPGLTSMSAEKLKAWWDLLVMRGLVVPSMIPDTLKSACSCMAQFMLHCPADPSLTVVLGTDRASSHFREKATFVQPVSPLAIDGSDVRTDDEKSKRDEDWRLFTVMHDIQLSRLCDKA